MAGNSAQHRPDAGRQSTRRRRSGSRRRTGLEKTHRHSSSTATEGAAGAAESFLFRDTPAVRYLLLVLAVAAQAVTIVITWPVWQVRQKPPLLPAFETLPEIPFAWIVLGSLAITLWRPRFGIWLHLAVLIAAALFDQFRTQPQFLANWILMLAVTQPWGTQLVRWFLVTFWFWAGFHKLVSPDWWSYRAFDLVAQSNTSLDPNQFYLWFAGAVALSEIALGLLAWLRPRWAAWGCVALHLGIVVYLSPWFRDWNYSVLPWNLATAVIGYWVLTAAARQPSVTAWERGATIVLAVYPATFYLGWVDHGYAHVLYSDYLPRGYITKLAEPHEEIYGWGGLAVPFPNERRTFRQYFAKMALPGEKLHIADPRPLLDDEYWIMTRQGPRALPRDEFQQKQTGAPAGILIDSRRSVFLLAQAGATMRKRTPDSMIFAVVFSPEHFEPRQLEWLQGLPNLEQIQLSGTAVRDRDLQKLQGLTQLTGIGLDDTAVTDAGLAHLQDLPRLRLINCRGTSITPEAVRRVVAGKGRREAD